MGVIRRRLPNKIHRKAPSGSGKLPRISALVAWRFLSTLVVATVVHFDFRRLRFVRRYGVRLVMSRSVRLVVSRGVRLVVLRLPFLNLVQLHRFQTLHAEADEGTREKK